MDIESISHNGEICILTKVKRNWELNDAAKSNVQAVVTATLSTSNVDGWYQIKQRVFFKHL